MTNHSASAAGLILACVLLGSLILGSCTSTSTDTTTSDTTRTSVQLTSPTATTVAPVIYLSSLTVSAAVIKANPNVNIMFIYYTSAPAWRLRGWLFENTGGVADVFSPTPDLVLEPDGGPQLAIGVNTYLGNLVLTRADENRIRNLIGNRTATLRFKPMYNAGSKTVSYEISIEVLKDGRRILLAERIVINPCPPRCSID